MKRKSGSSGPHRCLCPRARDRHYGFPLLRLYGTETTGPARSSILRRANEPRAKSLGRRPIGSRVAELLGNPKKDLCDFEWYYWRHVMERSIPLAFNADEAVQAETAELVDVLSSPDGKHLAAISRDSVVQGWNLKGNKPHILRPLGLKRGQGGCFSMRTAVSFGRHFLLEDNKLHVVNTQSGEEAYKGQRRHPNGP